MLSLKGEGFSEDLGSDPIKQRRGSRKGAKIAKIQDFDHAVFFDFRNHMIINNNASIRKRKILCVFCENIT